MNTFFRTNFVVPMTVGIGLLLATPTVTADEEVMVVRMGTLPGLQYDLKQFDVRPGAKVKLIFRNDDTMQHNLLIVKPGTREKVVAAATALGGQAAEKNYVPDTENVLWSIGVVDQGSSQTLEFTAPASLGNYPYVCTYPGHGQIMFGTMRVTNDPQEPVKNKPLDTTSTVEEVSGGGVFVKRVFMSGAGPAAIAVRLPGGHSYCWDAGACRFRYAWRGEFVKSGFPDPDQPAGEIYYREDFEFPLHLGDREPVKPDEIRFLGYTLDEAGIPEFEYRIDGIVVRERLSVQGGHLLRRFRATNEDKPFTIWLRTDPAKADQLHSKGKREGDFLKFAGEDATEFVITISPKPQQMPHAGH